jgi:tRNA(Ile)-lysidine synthase
VRLGTVSAVLDRRLSAQSARPIAVAFSGGGDSLALLLEAQAWAQNVGRELIVLTVDHRLQRESSAWTTACSGTAARLGAAFQALPWVGDKPASGLPAAARTARHRLLAVAARQAGAGVILMGHTADDILEARLMRTRGATTPDPREWSPSPVWPEGRGLFLLRPLLSVRRGEIRAWLAERGESWIDDPANVSPLSARALARRDIALGAATTSALIADHLAPQELARMCDTDMAAGLRLPRAALRTAAAGAVARFVSAACLCAAGTDRPAAGARVSRLAERLIGTDGFAATLAGARIEADDAEVRFLREAGEAARGGLKALDLARGETGVWDGRFEVSASRPTKVCAAAGLRPQLSPEDGRRLAALPASARDVVPVGIDESGEPQLISATPLSLARLLAACGAVESEPD